MDMREQIKKRFKKRRYAVLLTLFVGVLFFLLRGQFSHAADQIFIQFNGADLDPAVTYDMTTSTMQLMLGTPEGDHVYDDVRYKVEWTIEDTAARDVIASISPGTSKNIGIVKALSPGDVTVTLTVKDSMGLSCSWRQLHHVVSVNDCHFRHHFVTDDWPLHTSVRIGNDSERSNFGTSTCSSRDAD